MASSLYTELSYDRDIRAVTGVQFYVLSPDEIRRQSVCPIVTTDTFCGQEPQIGGLFDARMGTLDPTRLCATCHSRMAMCPGHFGHIELAKPVFHFPFLDVVKKLLRCVCVECSHLMVDLARPDIQAILARKCSAQKRWEVMSKECGKARKCPRCDAMRPDKVSREAVIKLLLEWKDGRRSLLTAEDVLLVLKRISNEHVRALGFSPKDTRPEWMITTVVPVPPPAVRPSVRNDIGQRQEDDLTHKLIDIVKFNGMLRAKLDKGLNNEQIDNWWQLLTYHVCTLTDNQIPGLNPAQQRTGRLLKSVSERLKSKEGRIRGNLLGKRVDFSARTVITPDPCISIEELGVPLRIAQNLTFPQVVTPASQEELRLLVLAGPDQYPGAKYVHKASASRTIRLKGIDRSAVAAGLELGDVVHRHMRDGDWVLFNRQPSLHRMSAMAHKVIVMPDYTFRLNVMVTAPYNADFDGDEMNLHMPQSVTTMNELRELAAVTTQVISPRECKPIISICQDVALGVYKMTRPGVSVDARMLCNLLCPIRGAPAKMHAHIAAKRPVAGRLLLSSILPTACNYRGGEGVVIERGWIRQGTINKPVYQGRSAGLLHTVFMEEGGSAARDLLDNTQRLCVDWLMSSGFSTGLSDLFVDAPTQSALDEVIRDMKSQVYDIIRCTHQGTFHNATFATDAEHFESVVNGLLNQANNRAGEEALRHISDDTNRMVHMIRAMSKGNTLNIAQMMACLGQQNVDGKRIAYGFDGRTLPHFTRYDDGPTARGFVESSFFQGLAPEEFFFHSMGGREGLIDTAVKSVTGDTPVFVLIDGQPLYTRVGDWVDSLLKRHQGLVEHHDFRNMELLRLLHRVYVPTCDAKGAVTWGRMTAVTRHDPGGVLYEISTASGRSVIVTDSKSLIVWDDVRQGFYEKATPDVRVGDHVPVMVRLGTAPEVCTHMSVDGGSDDSDSGDSMQSLGNCGVERLSRGERPSSHALEAHDEAAIPRQFHLNYDTGVFIGLYLASGCSDASGVTITPPDNESGGLVWVEEWLRKSPSFSTCLTSRGSLRMDSPRLARFVQRLMGNGVNEKHIPDVAMVAPIACVEGIMSGFFSCAGTIRQQDLLAKSPWRRVTEGVSMLCARLGVFGSLDTGSLCPKQQKDAAVSTATVHTHELCIRGEWAWTFANRVRLIHKVKQEALEKADFAAADTRLRVCQDVVLDAIVDIKLVSATTHPKVYDVTVPSTTNFALWNGLVVYDTSETGYIYRKLIKGMEDCKVHFDLTTRNAAGSIIQFLAGEDGIDSTKLESNHLWYMALTPEEIKQEVWVDTRFDAHLAGILDDREFMAVRMFRGELERSVLSPVNFDRVLARVAECASDDGDALDAGEALGHLEAFLATLALHRPGEPDQPNSLMRMLARAHLSPKRVLRRYRLSGHAYHTALQAVRRVYQQAVVHPGEMIGIIAAQSLGEPSTQLTLNTFHSSGISSASKAVRGVPRLNELMTVSKNIKTPMMTIFLRPPHNASKVAADRARSALATTTLRQLVLRSSIVFGFSPIYPDIVPSCVRVQWDTVSHAPWVLRLELDPRLMFCDQLTMIDIEYAVTSFYGDRVVCHTTDDNDDEMLVHIALRLPPDASADCVQSQLTELRALEKGLLESVCIKGIRGVAGMVLRKVDAKARYSTASQTYEPHVEWALVSEGTNLVEVLGCAEYVDVRRTVSNDVAEVLQVLGIEAARQALFNELSAVVQDADLFVQFHHLGLLCDTMTSHGTLVSMHRHGLNRNGHTGVLSRMSFEETCDMITKAGIFADKDPLTGVTANLMFGQLPPCGTGDSGVLLDDTLLPPNPVKQESAWEQALSFDSLALG